MAEQARKRVFKLRPKGLFDLTDPRVRGFIGREVQKTQPAGCPRNGTLGHCYVQTLDGDFIGLVLESSLVSTNKTAVPVDKAAEAREARSRRIRGA